MKNSFYGNKALGFLSVMVLMTASAASFAVEHAQQPRVYLIKGRVVRSPIPSKEKTKKKNKEKTKKKSDVRLQEGDKVPLGSTVKTEKNSYIILEYHWKSDVPYRLCHCWIVISGGKTYQVPSKKRASHQCRTEIQGTELRRAIQGKSIVSRLTFYGGGGKSEETPPPKVQASRDAYYTKVFNTLRKMRRSFLGTVHFILDDDDIVIMAKGKTLDGFKEKQFLVTKDTKIIGAEAVSQLKDKKVWIDYISSSYSDEPKALRIVVE